MSVKSNLHFCSLVLEFTMIDVKRRRRSKTKSNCDRLVHFSALSASQV